MSQRSEFPVLAEWAARVDSAEKLARDLQVGGNPDAADQVLQWARVIRDAFDRERRRRMTLLALHAYKGIVVGLLLMWFGGPALFENEVGSWTRLLLGWWALLGGATLFVGVRILPPRRLGYRMQWLGLGAMGLWDILIALSTVVVIVTYDGGWQLGNLWSAHELPTLQPRIFGVAVYLALAAMLWRVHLPASLAEWRSNRDASS